MNTNTNTAPEREEIEQLLPWHAAGTLSRREAQRVEDALSRDPELARQFALVREELAETIHVNETLGAPSARAMERLIAGIEAESGPARQEAPRFSLVAWVNERLSAFSPRTLAYAATAATVALVLQFGVLTGIAVNRAVAPTAFETASGPATTVPAEVGSFALIAFAPDAGAATVTEFLERHNLTIVDGPRAGGMYRVRISAKPLSQAEVDETVKRLRGEGAVVRFVAPTE
jgi:hypothetical protein